MILGLELFKACDLCDNTTVKADKLKFCWGQIIFNSITGKYVAFTKMDALILVISVRSWPTSLGHTSFSVSDTGFSSIHLKSKQKYESHTKKYLKYL